MINMINDGHYSLVINSRASNVTHCQDNISPGDDIPVQTVESELVTIDHSPDMLQTL